jgi:drug/metabolite transporter (DMT)-like permease
VLTSVLLMMQPLLAVIFAALLVDERPSELQLAGAGAILAGVLLASSTRPGTAAVPAPAPGAADA